MYALFGENSDTVYTLHIGVEFCRRNLRLFFFWHTSRTEGWLTAWWFTPGAGEIPTKQNSHWKFGANRVVRWV
jgi:hypothetical protein